MGGLGTSDRLLLLPLLLTVGGELRVSAAASRVPGLRLGQGREQGGRREPKGKIGIGAGPQPPKPYGSLLEPETPIFGLW